MGLFDIIRGHRKPTRPNLDNLFALSTARATLEVNLALEPMIESGVCFRPADMVDFERTVDDLHHLLEVAGRRTSTGFRAHHDDMGFEWVILRDSDFEEMVTTSHMVNQTMQEEGYGSQLLCSVFGFHDKDGGAPIYLIYGHKRGTFYPFVPTGENRRDNTRELRLKTSLDGELPIEPELERWFPVWGVPLSAD
ncbi:MAG: hypothetical protein HKO98_04480 [Gemmatimonadetes bacterium]|nr:hypothetical protein [Gemmatimonadota bacterium]